MNADGGSRIAWSHCLLAVEAAINLHRHGVPKSLVRIDHWDKIVLNEAGMTIDKTRTCSERLDLMRIILKDDKSIALDIIGGEHVDRFVRNPEQLALEKVDAFNSQHNSESRNTLKRSHQEIGQSDAGRSNIVVLNVSASGQREAGGSGQTREEQAGIGEEDADAVTDSEYGD
jgi:hypothetical protein